MTVRGIDIAKYQLVVNHVAVAASGIEVCAAKATNGISIIDPMFSLNRSAMKTCYRWRVFYGWLRPDQNPVDQANAYMNVVGEFKPGEGWMLDFEQPGCTGAMAKAWIAQVRNRSGKHFGLCYTGMVNTEQGFMGSVSWNDTNGLWDDGVGRFPAAFTNEAHMRQLAGKHADEVVAWQYADNLTVPGISTLVDGDLFYDMDFMDKVCGYDAPTIVTPIEVINPAIVGNIRHAMEEVDMIIMVQIDGDPDPGKRYGWTGSYMYDYQSQDEADQHILSGIARNDLAHPYVMPAGEANKYPKVLVGQFP